MTPRERTRILSYLGRARIILLLLRRGGLGPNRYSLYTAAPPLPPPGTAATVRGGMAP